MRIRKFSACELSDIDRRPSSDLHGIFHMARYLSLKSVTLLLVGHQDSVGGRFQGSAHDRERLDKLFFRLANRALANLKNAGRCPQGGRAKFPCFVLRCHSFVIYDFFRQKRFLHAASDCSQMPSRASSRYPRTWR